MGIDADAMCAIIANVPVINRNTPAMKMRGHPLNREKFFLVSGAGTPVYRYPGFQYGSTALYKSVAAVLIIDQLLTDLNNDMIYTLPSDSGTGNQPTLFNHMIGTKYASATDSIRFHSDKVDSYRRGGVTVIFSFGAVREFHVRHKVTGELTALIMRPGDMFFMGPDMNDKYEHSLVRVDGERLLNDPTRLPGVRWSLCFRSIKEKWTRADLDVKIAKCEADRIKRAEQAKRAREVGSGWQRRRES
jgi:hypothetical protein